MEPGLEVKLGPLQLRTPVMPASGTFGYGDEYKDLIPVEVLGAVVTKSISLTPSPGNPPPRLWEVEGGLINSIGLQNVGIDAFLEGKLPSLRELGVPIIVSFFGMTEDEYPRCAERLCRAEGIAALEANLSCPHVKRGGMAFGAQPEVVQRITRAVKEVAGLPLLVKLPPDPFHILEIAEGAVYGGADALTLANTLPAMVVDIERQKPSLGGGVGGLSGPALKPVALRIVYEVSRKLQVPIVASGGIRSASDAVEFIMVGATALQVGTATFADPMTIPRVVEGLKTFLKDRGYDRLQKLQGIIHGTRMESVGRGRKG